MLTGAAGMFSSGYDIGDIPDDVFAVEAEKLVAHPFTAALDALDATDLPTVAALPGHTIGGGLELALCCDIRIAAAHSRLGMPEVRLGVMPGSGGTQRLPAVVGPAHAKELIFTGELIDAARAAEIGLVNRVVPTGGARAAAIAMGETIAQRGPIPVREAKRLIEHAHDFDIDAGLAAELDASDRVFSSEDMLEGARSFFAKRPPDFSGH